MPLDPRIPLGVQAPQIANPLDLLQQVTQLQGLREQRDARQADAAEKAAARQRATKLTQALQGAMSFGPDGQPTIDFPKLLPDVPPEQLFELKKAVDENDERMARLKALNVSNSKLVTQYLGGLARAVQKVDNTQHAFDLAVTTAGLAGALPPDQVEQHLAFSRDPEFRRNTVENAITLADEDESKDLVPVQTVKDGVAGTQFVRKTPDAFYPSVPKAEPAETHSPIYREWQDYKAEGGTLDFNAYQTADANRRATRVSVGGVGGTAAADRESLIAAVIDNPGLWDQITPTERGRIAGELRRRGFTGFGKPLPEAAIKQITQSKTAIAALTDLREVLKKNEQYIGPVAGLQALNPYSAARQAQADIDRVRQRVGKALEGGVLRKEDEEKYRLILATLRDTPETAIYKVDQLMEDLNRDIQIYTNEQRLAGRRVPQAETKSDPLTVTAPNGKTYTFKTATEAAAFKKRAGIP